MTLVASSLSQICRAIADVVGAGLNGAEVVARVTIGTPADAVPAETDMHRLNFFFFRFEPYGFDADVLPGETLFLRAHCLVTPFAIMEDSVSAGENDLRLVGEVVRIFHETPVFLVTVDGNDFHVQVVFQNLPLDQINQLWSTQGDVAYRPSLLYEVALAPVIPAKKAIASPLVAGVGLGVRAEMKATEADRAPRTEEMSPITVATTLEDWAPAITFVIDGRCTSTIVLALESPELAALDVHVWIAGAPAAGVTLSWEVWDRAAGWRPDGVSVAAAAAGPTIDPAAVATAATTAVTPPFVDRAGQAVLYASRTYVRASDGASLSVRSNPLLINLYPGAA